MNEATNWKAPFFTIWTGQAFSLVGSRAVQFALVWWLTDTTGSATVLATASLVALIPEILIGPIAGAYVDRWSRRSVMLAADALIALASVWLAVMFWLDAVQIWHIYVLAAVRAIGGGFHSPAMMASTSLMVPRDQLTRVAGINQTLQGALSIVGPPLGALVMALMPMHGVMLLDVGTAALAIVPLLFVHIPQPKREIRADASGKKPTIWADIREGVRYIQGWPGMMLLIGLAAILKIVNTPAISLMPLLVRSHFGGGAAQLSLLQAVFGVGIILGGVVLSVWGGFQRKIYTTLTGMALVGLGFLGLGLTPSELFPMAVGYGFMMGFFVPIVDGPVMAILQTVVAPEMQGRVFTLIFSLLMLTSPLGLMVAGPISDWLGLRIWYILSGVTGCLFAIACFLIPAIRYIEDNPNGVPEAQVSSEPLKELV